MELYNVKAKKLQIPKWRRLAFLSRLPGFVGLLWERGEVKQSFQKDSGKNGGTGHYRMKALIPLCQNA